MILFYMPYWYINNDSGTLLREYNNKMDRSYDENDNKQLH